MARSKSSSACSNCLALTLTRPRQVSASLDLGSDSMALVKSAMASSNLPVRWVAMPRRRYALARSVGGRCLSAITALQAATTLSIAALSVAAPVQSAQSSARAGAEPSINAAASQAAAAVRAGRQRHGNRSVVSSMVAAGGAVGELSGRSWRIDSQSITTARRGQYALFGSSSPRRASKSRSRMFSAFADG